MRTKILSIEGLRESLLAPVRAALRRPHLKIEQSRALAQREGLLYPMYPECRSTGRLLQRRAS